MIKRKSCRIRLFASEVSEQRIREEVEQKINQDVIAILYWEETHRVKRAKNYYDKTDNDNTDRVTFLVEYEVDDLNMEE